MAPPSAGRASVECLGCRVLMQVVMILLRGTDDLTQLKQIITDVGCPLLETVAGLHRDVCAGALELYAV